MAQNRLAASRYRDKRRLAKEHALAELALLEERHTRLQTTASALTSEIDYLKRLMKEVGM